MKRKMDFTLMEDDYRKVIFRFYPRQTFVHGFEIDYCPKTWEEVYKVYYSFAIIQYYKDDNGNIETESADRLLYMYCDECSQIPNLKEIIEYIMNNDDYVYDYPTIGQPAIDWKISKRKGVYEWKDNEPYEYYNFEMFDNWLNVGYRFTLDRKQVEEFCKYLDKINQYALEHSVPI